MRLLLLNTPDWLAAPLAAAGHRTARAADAREAALDAERYDALLVGGMAAASVAALRKREVKAPIVALASLAAGSGAVVEALNAGADDATVLPADMPAELLARLAAAARRLKAPQQPEAVFGPIRVVLGEGTCFVRPAPDALEREVKLTGKEAAILATLARAGGRTLGKEQILAQVYTALDDEPEIKIIDVFVCKLRKRLRLAAPGAEAHIETVWGRGYRLVERPLEPAKSLPAPAPQLALPPPPPAPFRPPPAPRLRGITHRAMGHRVLRHLALYAARPKDLVAAFQASPSYVSHALGDLEAKGWAARHALGRARSNGVIWEITAAGREALAAADELEAA